MLHKKSSPLWTVQDPDADSASVTSDDESHDRKSTFDPSMTSSDPSLTLDSGWESLTVDLESWEVLLKQSEDLLSLTTLLHIHTDAHSRDSITVSVSRLLLSGKGKLYQYRNGISFTWTRIWKGSTCEDLCCLPIVLCVHCAPPQQKLLRITNLTDCIIKELRGRFLPTNPNI